MGAQKAGYNWIIAEDAEKRCDARIKSGKYIKPKVKEDAGNGSTN